VGNRPGAKSALKEGRWFAWAISLFVLAGALSALFSIDPLRSWKAVLRYSTYPVVAIGILRTGKGKRRRLDTQSLPAQRGGPLRLRAAAGLGSQPELRRPGLEAGYAGTSAGLLDLVIPRVNGTLNNANALAMYLLTVAGWGPKHLARPVGRKRPYVLLLGGPFPSS